MPFLRKKIKVPFLKELYKISKFYNTNVFLVGGAIRDSLCRSSKELKDFDFAVEKHALEIAKEFSKISNASLVILDEENKFYRVVYKTKKHFLNYDFTEFRGKNLLEDLRNRDFTINALAIHLKDLLEKKQIYNCIIDPFGGLEDIKKRILRMIEEKAFLTDPLRILRTFSLSANLEFEISKDTLKAIKKYKEKIKKVAKERIKEELFKIFSVRYSYKYFFLMDKFRVLDVLIPQARLMRRVGKGGYHHLNSWDHSLETLMRLELLYERRLKKDKKLSDYLNQVISSNHTRYQLLKFASLLHDIGKPFAYKRKEKKTIFYEHEKIGAQITQDLVKSMRLSSDEVNFLQKLVFYHLRPGFMVQDLRFPTKRAIFRFFKDTDPEGISILILAIADYRATRGKLSSKKEKRRKEEIFFKIIKEKLEENPPPPKLIDGYLVMKKFDIPPSPLVGKILDEVRELQILGKIRTKKQALEVAKEIYEKYKEKIF